MPKFKITYRMSENVEEVDADGYNDNGQWIDFHLDGEQVLRVQAGRVDRIDMVG